MAREVNSGDFAGSPVIDVDVDAATFRRVVRNAQRDLARCFDDLTGENSAPTPIDHRGGGQGALLGIPVWQQRIGRSLFYRDPVIGGKQAAPGPTWICAQPAFIPRGEEELDVEVTGSGIAQLGAVARITTSAGVDIDVQPLREMPSIGGRPRWGCRLTGLTRQLCLVFLEVDTSRDDGAVAAAATLHSWRGFFRRMRPPKVATRNESGANCGVTTPGATQGVAFVDIDSHRFADRRALDGHIIATINRNLRGLEEFGSRWPAGGNASYTHVDHDGAGVADVSDPARSRFSAGTRSLYASEPEPDFPLFSEAFGAFRLDGGPVVDATTSSPPVAGLLGWFAPYPLSAAVQIIRQCTLRIPDFQTAASRLRWAILAGTDQAADIGNWQGSVTGLGGTGTGTFGAAFAAGASGSVLSLATGTGLAFTGDALSTASWRTQRTAGVFDTTRTEIFMLGAALWFEP